MNKIFTKDALDKLLGKENALKPIRLVSKLRYVSGIPAFNSILEGKIFNDAIDLLNLRIRPHGLQFELLKGWRLYSVGLAKSAINAIVLENKKPVYIEQQNVFIGRAIAWRLLAGASGMIIGAMTGFSSKRVKEKKPGLSITINYTAHNEEKTIVLSCQAKDKKAVTKFFQEAFPALFKIKLNNNYGK